jgi:hypothetical protein
MTIPLANSEKVKDRKKKMSDRNLYPEDDMNKSYVFDAQADKSAREGDIEQAVPPVKKKKKKTTKAAREKKRLLEEKYGGSQQALGLKSQPPARPGLPQSGGSLPVLDSHMPSGEPLEHTQETLPMSGSDDSLEADLDVDDIENGQQKAPIKRAPSKARDMDNPQSGNPKPKKQKSMKRTKSSDELNPGSKKDLTTYLHDQEGAPQKNLNASRGSLSQDTMDSSAGKRVVKMRDTDRLIRPRGRGVERQDSTNVSRGSSGSGRPSLQRNNSGRSTTSNKSTTSNGSKTSKGKPKMPRGQSVPVLHRDNSLKRSGSVSSGQELAVIPQPPGRQPSIGRQQSMRPPQTRPTAGGGPQRSRSQSSNFDRGGSSREGFRRGNSVDGRSVGSTRSGLSNTRGQQSNRGRMMSNADLMKDRGLTAAQARSMRGPPRRGYDREYLRKKFEIEERPSRSLMLIWVVMCAELGMDLGTTIIAFQSLVQEGDCCGETMELGDFPMGVTMPFFFLIVTELAFLIRTIMLTVWPSMVTGEETDEQKEIQNARTYFMKFCCCCLKMNIHALMGVINLLVLLNPFFGCVIAWMLLYQSDKQDSFLVLGLEGASILLHFLSVYLEGTCKTICNFLFVCIPLLPFAV